MIRLNGLYEKVLENIKLEKKVNIRSMSPKRFPFDTIHFSGKHKLFKNQPLTEASPNKTSYTIPHKKQFFMSPKIHRE